MISGKIKQLLPNSLKHSIKPWVLKLSALAPLKRMEPSFIVAGIQKGGTTALYTYLSQHPQVKPILQKEIHFFDRNYEQGLRWYLGNFPVKSRSGEIAGEATPTYLYSAKAPGRIRQHFPKTKIIFLLRNPGKRAYSDYCYGIKLGIRTDHAAFEDRIRREMIWTRENLQELQSDKEMELDLRKNCAYVAPGLYSIWLKKWFDVFEEDQILILKSEDFFRNSQQVMDRICGFLQLEPHKLEEYKKVNANTYPPIDPEIAKELNDFYKPFNEDLRLKYGLESGTWL